MCNLCMASPAQRLQIVLAVGPTGTLGPLVMDFGRDSTAPLAQWPAPEHHEPEPLPSRTVSATMCRLSPVVGLALCLVRIAERPRGIDQRGAAGVAAWTPRADWHALIVTCCAWIALHDRDRLSLFLRHPA